MEDEDTLRRLDGDYALNRNYFFDRMQQGDIEQYKHG
jgi:hypothetical protein